MFKYKELKKTYRSIREALSTQIIAWNIPVLLMALMTITVTNNSSGTPTDVATTGFSLFVPSSIFTVAWIINLIYQGAVFNWSDVHKNKSLENKIQYAKTLTFKDSLNDMTDWKLALRVVLVGIVSSIFKGLVFLFALAATIVPAFFMLGLSPSSDAQTILLTLIFMAPAVLLFIMPTMLIIAWFVDIWTRYSVLIMRDKYKAGEKINYIKLIKESMTFVKGHKMELFKLDLSYFGYFFLVGLLSGVFGALFIESKIAVLAVMLVLLAFIPGLYLSYTSTVTQAYQEIKRGKVEVKDVE